MPKQSLAPASALALTLVIVLLGIGLAGPSAHAQSAPENHPLWTYHIGQDYKGGAVRLGADLILIAAEDRLIALDAEANLKWTYDPGRDSVRSVSASSDGNTIVLTSGTTNADKYATIKVSVLTGTGGVLWESGQIRAGTWARATVSADGSTIMVPYGLCAGNGLQVFNREGSLLWDNLFKAMSSSWNYCSLHGMWLARSTPDGSAIYAVGRANAQAEGSAILYSFNRQGTLLWSEKVSTDDVWSLSTSHDGSIIYIGARDSRIYAYSQDGSRIWSHSTTDGIEVLVRTVPDGSWVVVGSRDGFLRIYDRSGQNLFQVSVGDFVRSVTVSQDETMMAAGTADGTIIVMNRVGEVLWRYKGVGSAAAAFAGDDQFVITSHKQEQAYRLFPIVPHEEHAPSAPTDPIPPPTHPTPSPVPLPISPAESIPEPQNSPSGPSANWNDVVSLPSTRLGNAIQSNPRILDNALGFQSLAADIDQKVTPVLAAADTVLDVRTWLQSQCVLGVCAWGVLVQAQPGVSQAFEGIDQAARELRGAQATARAMEQASTRVAEAIMAYQSVPTPVNEAPVVAAFQEAILVYRSTADELNRLASRIDEVAFGIQNVQSVLDQGRDLRIVGGFVSNAADTVGNVATSASGVASQVRAPASTMQYDANVMEEALREEPRELPWLLLGLVAVGILFLVLLTVTARRKTAIGSLGRMDNDMAPPEPFGTSVRATTVQETPPPALSPPVHRTVHQKTPPVSTTPVEPATSEGVSHPATARGWLELPPSSVEPASDADLGAKVASQQSLDGASRAELEELLAKVRQRLNDGTAGKELRPDD